MSLPFTNMTYEQFRLTLPIVDFTAIPLNLSKAEISRLYREFLGYNDFYRMVI